MEKLLTHHINETTRQFDRIVKDLKEIEVKIDALRDFKTETMMTAAVSAKWVSIIVSAVCGSITLAVTLAIQFYKH